MATIDYSQMKHVTANSASATEWSGTTKITISLDAETGYYFPVSPVMHYQYVSDSSNDKETITRQTSTNYTTAVKSVASVGEEVKNIYLEAKADPQNATVIQNLVNCTSDAPTTISTDVDADYVTITLTATGGATFETTPTLTEVFEDTSKNIVHNFTVSSDKSTATLSKFAVDLWAGAITTNLANLQILSNLTIDATATGGTVETAPVTTTTTDCTITFSPELTEGGMEIGATYTVTITANENCFFDENLTGYVPKFNYTQNGITTAIFTTSKTAYSSEYEENLYSSAIYEFTAETGTTAVSINAVAYNLPQQEFTVIQTLEQCTSDIPTTVKYNTEYTFTVTANEDYYFAVAPTMTYTLYLEEESTVNFHISTDGKTATATLNLPWRITGEIVITANAVPETVYTDKYGAVYIYNPTINELQQFSTQRFKQDDKDVDLGNFIPELNRIYCKIGKTFETTMKIGVYDLSDITTRTPYEDVVITDCGTITINGVNDTATDYQSKLKLFLPFIGFVDVEIDTTLNHELHLYYKTTILNGESIVILEVDNVAMFSWECKIAQKIMYRVNSDDKFNSVEFNGEFLYPLTPYALLTSYTDTNKSPYSDTNIRDYVKNQNGYFTMTELDNFTNNLILEPERKEIIDLLESGAFYEQ